MRTLYIAARIGASPELDALLVALVLPLVVSGLIAASLRTALVPAYLEVADSSGQEHARAFVGAIITWAGIVGIAATTLMILLPAQTIAISGPGLDESARAAGIHFVPIVAPILVVSAVSSLLGALCQVAGRFLPIAIGLMVTPLVSLLTTVTLWGALHLDALALGMMLGALATLLVTGAYVAAIGLLPPIAFRADRREARRFIAHAVPLTAGSAVLQFNLLADRAVASLLGPGAVSALSYGQQIVLQPLGSLSSAWTTVVYPWLVHTATRSSASSLGTSAMTSVRYTLALFIPIAAATAALAPLIVNIFYRRGAFDADAARATSEVVAAFAGVLVFTMIQPIITGTHNARRRGTLLASAAVLNAALNVALDVVFGFSIGVAGVGLSTSITVGVVLVYLASRIDEPGFALGSLISVGTRSLVASLIPAVPIAVAAWVWLPALPTVPSILILCLALMLGLVSYMALARLVRVSEPAAMMHLVVNRFRVREGHAG